MNNDIRAALAALPVPWNGGPAAACVIVDDAGLYRVAWLVGTSKLPTPIAFDKPRDAARASAYLNERNQQ